MWRPFPTAIFVPESSSCVVNTPQAGVLMSAICLRSLALYDSGHPCFSFLLLPLNTRGLVNTGPLVPKVGIVKLLHEFGHGTLE